MRFRILRLLQEKTRLEDRLRRIGPEYMGVSEVAAELGLDETFVIEIADELKEWGWVDYMTLGRTACVITRSGRAAIEDALRNRRSEIP